MDDPLPQTFVGDTSFEETDDSTESEPDPKDDSVVLPQLAANPLVIPLIPLTDPPNVKDPLTQDVQDLPPKGVKDP